MAGALLSTPTQFPALTLGSGHSVGGGNYPDGTPVYSSVYTTFNTSAVTVVASGVSVLTFTVNGFGPGDYINACSGATAIPQGIVINAYLSAASTVALGFSNTSGATTTVPITTVVVHLVKITP